MQTGVLSLGERIVLAGRLAAIEHVRQELAAEAQRAIAELDAGAVGDGPAAVTDDPDGVQLSRPATEVLGELFHGLEQTTPMPRTTTPKRRKPKEAA